MADVQELEHMGATPEGRSTLQDMSNLYEAMRAGAVDAESQNVLRTLAEGSRYFSGGPK